MRIALGFRVKTGRAVGLSLLETDSFPKVIARHDLELSDLSDVSSRQPYHAALELSEESMRRGVVSRVTLDVKARARRALRAAVEEVKAPGRDLDPRGRHRGGKPRGPRTGGEPAHPRPRSRREALSRSVGGSGARPRAFRSSRWSKRCFRSKRSALSGRAVPRSRRRSSKWAAPRAGRGAASRRRPLSRHGSGWRNRRHSNEGVGRWATERSRVISAFSRARVSHGPDVVSRVGKETTGFARAVIVLAGLGVLLLGIPFVFS